MISWIFQDFHQILDFLDFPVFSTDFLDFQDFPPILNFLAAFLKLLGAFWELLGVVEAAQYSS